uniref:Maestro heat like repeat family member 7 n=1 Tax=Loxodonta africana TaxID=9785 RepID=G3UDW7_LOXAF
PPPPPPKLQGPHPLSKWTIQALDEMLQALVMDDMNPDMLMLQNFLEIILPWLTLSEKGYEQARTLGTISRLLRFICNFPELSNMMEFSVSGQLMGTFGLFCMDPVQEISTRASEALHYLFKILVLQRNPRDCPHENPEAVGHSRSQRGIPALCGRLLFFLQFFKKYLTPGERADMIMTSMEAMTTASRHDSCAASKMLKCILKDSIPEVGKVPEIIQYICDNMNNITEITAQTIVQKILYLLAQTYTDEVILTLTKMEDQSHKGFRRPWEILASFPQSYKVIMEHLLQRLTSNQRANDQEPSQRTQLSPLIATRAIYELLLEPSRRIEVQAFFPSLFMALLFQISFLVVERSLDITQDQQHIAEWLDPVSCTVEALKTLMRSSGYGCYVSDIQALGGWALLTNPEGHYDGVTLLARTMVAKNCWHNCPIFSLILRILQELRYTNHLTALVFMTELLRSRDVAAIVDDVTVHVLAGCFQYEEPATVKLLLQMAEIFAKHGNMVKWGKGQGHALWRYCHLGKGRLVRQLCILQPYVLNCCYSLDNDIVVETFLVLKCLVEHLTWRHSASFIIQLTFTLGPFFEEESEYLRFIAFEIYGALLAKVKRRVLVFPLKYQILNLVVLLVLHLKDVNASVAQVRGKALESGLQAPVLMHGDHQSWVVKTLAFLSLQVCRSALCHTATTLGWYKLREVFAEKDVWTILKTLLEQETNKALWFLNQCISLFKSPQAPIRQVAVWFAGQIIPILRVEETKELEEAHTALKYMQKDPDSMVSCLATQTCYILEVRERMRQDSTLTSCFCWRRPWRH